jgi:hypothetical protein
MLLGVEHDLEPLELLLAQHRSEVAVSQAQPLGARPVQLGGIGLLGHARHHLQAVAVR